MHSLWKPIVFLISAVLLSSCVDRDEKDKAEWNAYLEAAAEHFDTLCASKDCSIYPDKYNSAKMDDKWFYIPSPSRFPEIDRNVYVSVNPHNDKYYVEHGEKIGNHPSIVQRSIHFEASSVRVRNCCEELGIFYGESEEPLDLESSVLRLTRGTAPQLGILERQPVANVKTPALSIRYEIFSGIDNRGELDGQSLRIRSSENLYFDQKIEVHCAFRNCYIRSLRHSETEWPSFEVRGSGMGLCEGLQICTNEEELLARLDEMERKVKKIEALVRRFTIHPEEK